MHAMQPLGDITPTPYDEALNLAKRIEQLVAVVEDECGDSYGARLAKALAGNLVDQLHALQDRRAA